jgi:hypothetical protein
MVQRLLRLAVLRVQALAQGLEALFREYFVSDASQ